MALPKCRRCGKQDPQRMHGLMSLWFAPLIDLEADLGYFYLCPACHDEIIVPELERIQNRILELHPAAQRALDHELEGPEAAGEPDDGDGPSASGAEGEGDPSEAEDSGASGGDTSASDDDAGDEDTGGADDPEAG